MMTLPGGARRSKGSGCRTGWTLLLALVSVPVAAQPEARLADLANSRTYARALMESVERHWVRPASVPRDVPCPVRVIQAPGGEVVSVEAMPTCPYDAQGRDSVERAVIKASPLPYRGFEDQFNPRLLLNFRAEDGTATPTLTPAPQTPSVRMDPPPDSVDKATLRAHQEACRRHLQQAHRAAGHRDSGRRALVEVGLDGVLRAVRVQPTPTATADEDARWAHAVMSLPACAPMPGRADWGNVGYGVEIAFEPVP